MKYTTATSTIALVISFSITLKLFNDFIFLTELSHRPIDAYRCLQPEIASSDYVYFGH